MSPFSPKKAENEKNVKKKKHGKMQNKINYSREELPRDRHYFWLLERPGAHQRKRSVQQHRPGVRGVRAVHADALGVSTSMTIVEGAEKRSVGVFTRHDYHH